MISYPSAFLAGGYLFGLSNAIYKFLASRVGASSGCCACKSREDMNKRLCWVSKRVRVCDAIFALALSRIVLLDASHGILVATFERLPTE